MDLSSLATRLFAAEKYAFQFGMHRAAGGWFDLAAGDPDALADRRRWLRERPEWCRVWSPGAGPVLREALALFPGFDGPADGIPGLLRLGELWEPDFVLLRRGDDGEFRTVAGVVCFPSSWDLREKLGLGVTAVHDVVPTLNPTLGSRIRTFLDRLPAEGVFERENWGLAAHGDRNAHPERPLPRLGPGNRVSDTWLRVEHQAFRNLPGSGGLLFVIRLTVHPLAELVRIPGVAADLRRQLLSMPEEVARYKGIAPARDSLVEDLARFSDAA